MTKKKEILEYHATDYIDLCKLSEMIGYKRDYGYHCGCNLECERCSFVSSFLHFLDSNQGAVDAIVDYIKDNIDDYKLDI